MQQKLVFVIGERRLLGVCTLASYSNQTLNKWLYLFSKGISETLNSIIALLGKYLVSKFKRVNNLAYVEKIKVFWEFRFL